MMTTGDEIKLSQLATPKTKMKSEIPTLKM